MAILSRAASTALLAALVSACDGGEAPALRLVARHEASGPLAAPGLGSASRIILATTSGAGMVEILDGLSGSRLAGPFDSFATPLPPFELDGTVYLVSAAGRPAAYGLDGTSQSFADASAEGTPTGWTSDGSGRLVLTAGQSLHVYDAAGTKTWSRSLSGVAVGGAAIGDGRAWVATDTGVVDGIALDGSGAVATTLVAPIGAAAALEGGGAAVPTPTGVAFSSAAGAVTGEVGIGPVSGVVSAPSGSALAWTSEGTLALVSANGVTWEHALGAGLDYAPLSLGDGRFVAAGADGLVRLLDAGGELASYPLEGTPTAAPTLASDGRIWVVMGSVVVALDPDPEP